MEGDDKGGEDRASSTRDGASDPRPAAPPKRSAILLSLAPSPGPPANYRILVAVVWVLAQAVLVITASRRSDGAFGFRMFNESSTLELALHREIVGEGGARVRVHVDDGVWSARASDGTLRRLTWYDRVRTPYWVFDQEMHASYGAATQLERLQAALDDLASHVAPSDDLDTRRFLLDVTVRRNGREPVVHHLVSRERPIISHPETPRDARGAGRP